MDGSYLGEVIAITRTTSREASASKNLLFEKDLKPVWILIGLDATWTLPGKDVYMVRLDKT